MVSTELNKRYDRLSPGAPEELLFVAIRVIGRVQGVGYRMFAVRLGQEVGLTGWVCNTRDGAVELEVEGPRGVLVGFIAQLWEGPYAAAVRDVIVMEGAYVGRFREFAFESTR